MNVVVLPGAERDLRRIMEYFEWHGTSPSLGGRFLASFEQTCLMLASHPHIGKREEPPGGLPHPRAEVRRFPVRRFPSYLIFYKLEGTALLVERILHAARNPSLRLPDPS